MSDETRQTRKRANSALPAAALDLALKLRGLGVQLMRAERQQEQLRAAWRFKVNRQARGMESVTRAAMRAQIEVTRTTARVQIEVMTSWLF